VDKYSKWRSDWNFAWHFFNRRTRTKQRQAASNGVITKLIEAFDIWQHKIRYYPAERIIRIATSWQFLSMGDTDLVSLSEIFYWSRWWYMGWPPGSPEKGLTWTVLFRNLEFWFFICSLIVSNNGDMLPFLNLRSTLAWGLERIFCHTFKACHSKLWKLIYSKA